MSTLDRETYIAKAPEALAAGQVAKARHNRFLKRSGPIRVIPPIGLPNPLYGNCVQLPISSMNRWLERINII
jgi:hypothetical protein